MKDADDEFEEDLEGGASGLKIESFFTVAFLFELGLVLVAALIGYLTQGTPFPFKLNLSDPNWLGSSFAIGVVATVPPALFAVFATSRVGIRIRSIRSMYTRVKALIGQPLLRLSRLEVVLLAAAAGIGEEILFRGVLQPQLGIVATSVLFGVLHWLSTTYFVLASLMGYYCGWLAQVTGAEGELNLIVPITVHWLYDAVALFLFRRQFRAELDAEGARPAEPPPTETPPTEEKNRDDDLPEDHR